VFSRAAVYIPPPRPRLQAIGRKKRPNRHWRARIDTGAHQTGMARTKWRACAHELAPGGDESAADRGSGQGPGMNRPPPTCPPVRPLITLAAASLNTSSRAPTSAFLPTPVQHVCRPPSTPMLNRYYLSIVLSSLRLAASIYLWGTPRGPISLPDRRPPPCQSSSVRDFRPLIPAHGNMRLHGRLDGQSPAVGLQKRHQPRTFPARAASGLPAVLAAGCGGSCGSRG